MTNNHQRLIELFPLVQGNIIPGAKTFKYLKSTELHIQNLWW